MATDYILFIHGVGVRDEHYADGLYEQLKAKLQTETRTIQPLIVYWGDVTEPLELQLLKGYEGSSIWKDLWFEKLRATVLVRSIGDIALYITRLIGCKVAERVAEKIAAISDPSPDDRLHLVTHSLGTVILFDFMFSARWEQDVPCRPKVMAIREAVYGVAGASGNYQQGILLGSITTMGSPIGIFTLLDTGPGKDHLRNSNGEIIATHDITPELEQLLDYRYKELERQEIVKDKKLPWHNFVHPGDPIASPIENLIPEMVDPAGKYINIRDILVPEDLKEVASELLRGHFSEAAPELLIKPFEQTSLALLQTGIAHGSYWQREDVAKQIEEMIQRANEAP